MDDISYRAIGFIHSPFKTLKGIPIQPRWAREVAGTVELAPEYADGLKDLDGFSHIILVYHLHLSEGYSLTVKPYLDDTHRGVFATRAPRRPNPIGLSIVRLDKIEGTTLHVSNVDVADNTPLLDIKPYIPHFQEDRPIRIGWLEGKIDNAGNRTS